MKEERGSEFGYIEVIGKIFYSIFYFFFINERVNRGLLKVFFFFLEVIMI